MKKLIIPLLFLLFLIVVIASSPSSSLLSTDVSTLGTNSFDTLTIDGVKLEGDSIGIQLSLNKDSVMGWIQYQYITPDGYSDNAFNSSATLTIDELSSFTVDVGNQGVFSDGLPRVAGANKANFYVILKNIKSESQVITTKTYSITWR